MAVNSKRPYGWGDGPMIPNVGFQNYITTGFFAQLKFLKIQFQPEFVFAQNSPYQGFPDTYSQTITRDRFFYWNNGDYPERFGKESYKKFWWGQSKVSLNLGPVELAASSQNIWWGPGQFNALTISNNAQGFPHLSLNTSRPLKTFLGNFEAQIIMGRLESSGLEPSQFDSLNSKYFEKLSNDWRYLNGFSFSYQPKWIPGLFMGMTRTFQQYSEDKGDSFSDYFPVFEFLTKQKLYDEGNVLEYDQKGQDQQISIFGRYLFSKAHAEFYFEFGRRDHSYNWREFILNPEHARAYILGFQKLFPIQKSETYLQIRGEITQQQESVNRYIRYVGLDGNQTWHTHGRARGFANYGQALGVGSGVGSNVQTLEISQISGFNKRGILLERLANNQDFYYRAFGQNPLVKPWVDLSLGFLWDQQWNNLILSGKVQFIKSYNYQWIQQTSGPADLHKGYNPFAFYGTLNLIYRIGKTE
ncbi:capsule assembly Wzi family protein [Algoriphagus sp. AGSA1]|uniref:capsule assembly Wzi family protein n=1 Tax=Algoriphagus sp. AGSA1 TaxID=2907213 RepID=UPI001F195B29|nr:capsule assembly Wzi family protein [Algoriphagus sp. AGSA1]